MVLRKWVTVLLVIINIIALFILASDNDNLVVFFITHIIALIVFILNTAIIIRFGNKKYFK